MGVVLLEVPETRWECPSCHAQHVTREFRPHIPMHPCPALHGVLAPYAEVKGHELSRFAVRHVLREREDYVGDELVRTDDRGRPLMAIDTERADGSNDRHVFAPTAQFDFDPRRP